MNNQSESRILLAEKRGALAKIYPLIATDWHPTKNKELEDQGITPLSITKSSRLKVYWQCHTCMYEWRAAIRERSRGSGCAKCNIKIGTKKFIENKVKRFGSFADKFPYLMRFRTGTAI